MSTIQTTQVEDYTPYLRQLNEGQKKRKQAALEQAYRNSLAAITREEEGLEGTYRDAANAAAGTAAVSRRNFDQYAAANGLNNGAAGQAALAGNITLQNNLTGLEKQKAQEKSALALQKTTAGQEYESGLAKAEAEAEEGLAQALYEEAVRRAQAQYQANRDAVEDEQWQKEQDYKASRDAAEDAQWQQSMNYQASRDAAEDEQWLKEQDYKASRDAVKDEQWSRELEFAIRKYWYDNGYLTPPAASGSTGASGGGNTDLQSVAMQVIRGEWGNGAERRQRLTAAGYDYAAVQSLVDAMLASA